MRNSTRRQLDDLIITYDRVMKVMEPGAAKAADEDGRAYGGFIRAAKGKLQEHITEKLLRMAWESELQKPIARLEINSKKIPIPIIREYVENLPTKAPRDYITANVRSYRYNLSVDRHVFVDGKFVVAVECKAYAENAMLKRILVDFQLLKTKYPALHCYLFQLESQLGGDYSKTATHPKGSCPTHTLMSYFRDVDLRIVTLLDGERKVDRPINKPAFHKHLPIDRLEMAINVITEALKDF